MTTNSEKLETGTKSTQIEDKVFDRLCVIANFIEDQPVTMNQIIKILIRHMWLKLIETNGEILYKRPMTQEQENEFKQYVMKTLHKK
jgi:hypothetical protein